jgi:hypothetical protein
MNAHTSSDHKDAQRLRQIERGGLGDRIRRDERQRGQRVQRQVVDDGSPGTSQQRQESLGRAVRAKEVDGEVPFEHGRIAQVVVERQAGVVDQDVERFDVIDCSPNVRRVGHVQGQGPDAPIRMGQRPARAGVHPFRASV